MTADHPSQTRPSIVFTAGYLLVLLVGGLLLYEATLRIEHLFVKLHRRDGDIIGDERACSRFLTDLHDGLQEATVLGVHPSRLFGVLFATQFAIIRTIGAGPQNLGFALGTAANVLFDAVLAAIFFGFLVLVRFFRRLFNAPDEYAAVKLTYQPFHVDGRGGFRDFGRFATRIDVIPSLGGVSLVFRLYVVGGRGLPPGFADPLALTVWLSASSARSSPTPSAWVPGRTTPSGRCTGRWSGTNTPPPGGTSPTPVRRRTG